MVSVMATRAEPSLLVTTPLPRPKSAGFSRISGLRRSLEILPGQGLGPFRLGAFINTVFEQLQSDKTVPVDFIYSDANPLIADYVIDLRELGLRLFFNSTSQQLRQIDLIDPSKIDITFGITQLSATHEPLSLQKAQDFFGPSATSHLVDQYQTDLTLSTGLRMSFGMMSSTTSTLFRLSVFPIDKKTGQVWEETYLTESGEPAEVLTNTNRDTLYFSNLQRSIRLGDSCQDIQAALGAPQSIYAKKTPVLAVSSACADKESPYRQCPDYFLNYFSYGLDVQMDGLTHVAKKFILHTNFPGHPDFPLYHKCNFRLQTFATTSVDSLPSQDIRRLSVSSSTSEGDLLGIPELAPSPSTPRNTVPVGSSVSITPETNWHQLKMLLHIDGLPLLNTGPLTNNPFGPTKFYGHGNLIFEIMANDHIATVTIFSASLDSSTRIL